MGKKKDFICFFFCLEDFFCFFKLAGMYTSYGMWTEHMFSGNCLNLFYPEVGRV